MAVSRFKSVAKAEDHEDLSIVLQLVRNYESLYQSPDIEVPTREYVQRSERSGLPDGSSYDPSLSAPIGETIDKANLRLSREANEAWDLWTNTQGQPFIDKHTGKLVEPLKEDIQTLLIGEDKHRFTRVKRLLSVEEGRKKQDQEVKVARKVSESTNFKWEHNPSSQIPDSIRFYETVEKKVGEFGATDYIVVKNDRCKGKPDIKQTEGVQAADIKAVNGAPNHAERTEQINLSHYQTSIWRKNSRDEKDNYFPNTTPEDDPDYTNPLCISSRNFVIYPPASRPYNAVFVVTSGNKTKKIYPSGKKDYTSLSSMKYMLGQKGITFDSVSIEELKYKSGAKYPNCKFEPDLRVTYGPDLIPNPNSYKKVDPDSKLGMKLLQMLNEQPYQFKEFSWTHESEDGPEKKVAVGFEIPNPNDKIGPRIYWVYLDSKKNTIGKPRFMNFFVTDDGKMVFRGKRVHPQILYKPLKYPIEGMSFLPKEIPFIATVRVSHGYGYRRVNAATKQVETVGFEQFKAEYFDVLFKKGYLYIKEEKESLYSNVVLFHFVHKDLATKQQRRNAFLSLTKDRHD
jgi:hypothetical protein